MKRWQYLVLLVLGAACLCLSLVTIVFARQNRKLQQVAQEQQAIIQKGALSQQIGSNLLREMAAVAPSDEKMRDLLKENGYNVATPPTDPTSP